MARQRIQGVKKSRLQQLRDARALRQGNSKRRKLGPGRDDTEPQLDPSNDTDSCDERDEDDEGLYWYDSSDNGSADSSEDEDGEDDSASETENAPPPSLLLPPPPVQQVQLRWNETGEAKLQGAWGKGSSATDERMKRNARENQRQASQSYNIGAMFAKLNDRAANLGNRSKDSELTQEDTSLPRACLPPLTFQERQREIRVQALIDLERLLEHVTEQDKKYGYRLSPRTNFFQRHLMVKQFLSIQRRRLPGQTRRQLAISVAGGFGKSQTTGRNIVRWENSWVATRDIPVRGEPEIYASWLTDENVVMAIREFARKQGDSKTFFLKPSKLVDCA